MIKWIEGIPKESVVDIYAIVAKPEKEILSCTQKVDLQIMKIYVVSRSEPSTSLRILKKDSQKNLKPSKSTILLNHSKIKKPVVKLTFQEGVELLKENGNIINPLED